MVAIDYSFSRPTLAQLKAAKITDIFRYVGKPSAKTISQSEYDGLVGAGIRVWLVFENTANDSDGGFGAGVTNARTAVANLPAGYPADYPIFFAADKNLVGPSLAYAVQYIRGASTVLGPDRTGDYGPGALCQATHDAGYAAAHWQSASTSFNGNAKTLPITQVQQGVGGPITGTDIDTIVRPIVPVPAPAPPAPHPPIVAPSVEVDGMTLTETTYTEPCDNRGDGWIRVNVPCNQIVSITAGGPYPPTDGYWQTPTFGKQVRVEDGNLSLISWTGGPANGQIVVRVQVAS